jgi:methylmalonyl-CoA mutase
MKKHLFKDFESISAKEWKQKIQVDLKGADYNDTLIYNSEEGIDVKPFYHQDHHKNRSLPVTEQWQVTEKIYLENYAAVTKIVKDVVKRGAESLWLIVPKEDNQLFDLLTEINTLQVPVLLEFDTLNISFLKQLDAQQAELNMPLYLNFDPINRISAHGNWLNDETKDLELIKHLSQLKHITPQLSIDMRLHQNAGALKYQELGYSLGILTEYLNYIEEYKLPKKFQLNLMVSVGSNYFFEIAKLKAYRVLINTLSQSFSAQISTQIIAEPTRRNKTIYDYNVNMLRTTTESMSAVLGGANWVNNLAYDEIFHKTNEFGERISRNQLLILKHESYFDQVSNPTNGSYYIEYLCEQLAEKGLAYFKDIETQGGYLSQLFSGQITKAIEQSSEKEIQKVNHNDFAMVGTNTYQNPEDRMKLELELYPFVKKEKRQVKFKPIIPKRLAEKIELERLEQEPKA